MEPRLNGFGPEAIVTASVEKRWEERGADSKRARLPSPSSWWVLSLGFFQGAAGGRSILSQGNEDVGSSFDLVPNASLDGDKRGPKTRCLAG
jgi:hypothetical protein